MIRKVKIEDARRLAEIYNHYVLYGNATFAEEALSVSEMTDKIQEVTQNYPWFVYEEDGEILGYAYASQWRPKSAYRYSVESTIYLDKNALGKGIGKQIYSYLMTTLRAANYHTVIGVIAIPNDGSVALHEALGFEQVAMFKEIGKKFGEWQDVGYWQLIFGA